MKRLLLLLLAAGLTLSACKETEPAPEAPQTEQPEEEVFQIVPAPIKGIASPAAAETPDVTADGFVNAQFEIAKVEWFLHSNTSVDDTTFSGTYEGSLFIYNPNFEVNN